jgi:alkaline phosphatase D
MDSTGRHILDLARRGLLRGTAAAAALAAISPVFGQRAMANPVFRAHPFALGVASGDPWPDGVVIWTRLAPDPLVGGGLPPLPIRVTWEVAEDDRFARIVRSGDAIARPELGHSVHVEVDGLQPARTYHYRFHAGQETSATGRTRTAPAPDAMADRLRFVTAGCQHFEHGFFTAWDHVAREADLDFVFHYGDYIYEYRARGTAPGPVQAVRQHTGDEVYTLTDYRNRYALYKSDPDLQRAHQAHPFLSSFDDHEVDNNWAGDISEEDGTGRFPIAVPPEIFALRKQIAFQVWYESMPVRRAQLPRGDAITAHRALRWGRLADIAVLDTRSYRDDQPCGDGLKAPCAAVDNPEAQVLGPAQERWLFEKLARSTAVWKVLAQQVPVMRRDFGTAGAILAMDKWDAYPAARARLFRHIHEAGVRNVTVLTGDVHQAWAGTLRTDFADERSPVVGHEFIATSITSNGDGSEVLEATERVLSRNPHIKWFNNRRGYCLHDATPAGMAVTYRGLDYVSRPGAPAVDKARFVVEAGDTTLQRG